jgi:predicted RND superfamily exporter protein
MEPDGVMVVLGVAVAVLVALMVVLRYLRLPPEHAEMRRRRDELRRMLVRQRVIPPEMTKLEMAMEELNSRKEDF